MNKKQFILPYIALTGGDNPVVPGGGSGQGGLNTPDTPISYAAWLESEWKDDYIQDNIIDEDDYAAWWDYCGFTREDWERLNPGLDWDKYF